MNKKIGLALGGGSARGFAHIGVLKVLLENKIPFDYIAGCSMGSLIGGIFAAEENLETLESLAIVFDSKKYFDITLSTSGYVKGNKVQELLKLMTKNINIEKAAIPFSCIATCVEDAKLHRFTSGSISEAVRASISIPGLFTPYEIDGKTYIDGGVIDRTAIRATREMGADIVIAVDVSYRGEPLEKPKTVIDLLQDTFTISEWYLTQAYWKEADVLVLPEVHDIKGSEYKDTQKIIGRGMQAAEAALPDIKKALGIK
ncbi:MAG: patatin-like phospholipase family protein [Christensenella sp.]|uniref:patatin-like phospholipase family protein n=1 Tax=Christensenella sp. TaxID=1935934 RepID=UPI002B20C993|nr:patatin-like phospholipase family protein [Christensenella sp.]MEA5003712.1 patatin-like phospholipase family protein [Christensenella sp.]